MRAITIFFVLTAGLAGEYPSEPRKDSHQYRTAHYKELDSWLGTTLDEAPTQRLNYWKPDFSSLAAYERSIARQRADWERMLGVPPRHDGPFREKRVAVGNTAKVTVERVWIEVWPGVQAYGILITPKGLAKRAPVVVCLHGHGDSPELPTGIVSPSVYNDFARVFAEKGYITFSPYIIERYSEENQPQEGPDAWGRDILHKKAHMLGMTLVGIEARKLMRAIDWLETLPQVDKSRIGMYGLSKGGQYTLTVAALDPRIRVAVVSGWFNDRARKNLAQSTGSGGPMYFITHAHRSEYYFWNLLNQFSDAELGWLIAPRALLIENGDRDGAVLIDDARAEFERVQEVYRRLGLPEKAVFAGFSGGHQIDGGQSYPFLDRWLKVTK